MRSHDASRSIAHEQNYLMDYSDQYTSLTKHFSFIYLKVDLIRAVHFFFASKFFSQIFFYYFLPYSRHGWYVQLTYITEASLRNIKTVWMNKSSGIDLTNPAKPFFLKKRNYSEAACRLAHAKSLRLQRLSLLQAILELACPSLSKRVPVSVQKLSLTMSLIWLKINL